MFTLITGGSGSGKSEYAENLLVTRGGQEAQRYYLATMMPFGREAQIRIERHRKQRQGRGFITREQYLNLQEADIPEGADVLLECMSNLVANEMFDEKGSHLGACESIMAGVNRLLRRCRHLVIVTNEVFSDGIRYDDATMQYIRCLGSVNCQLADLADEITEVVYSIPVHLGKREEDRE